MNRAALFSGIGFAVLVALTSLPGALSDEAACNALGESCSKCTDDSRCYWCTNNKTCHFYQPTDTRTYFSKCSWGQARWKTCWSFPFRPKICSKAELCVMRKMAALPVNVEALVISMSVIGGIILIMLIACCCWCRGKCRARRQRAFEREEAAFERREMERQERHEQKRAERKVRTDEIRQKYGLGGGSGNYERMEN